MYSRPTVNHTGLLVNRNVLDSKNNVFLYRRQRNGDNGQRRGGGKGKQNGNNNGNNGNVPPPPADVKEDPAQPLALANGAEFCKAIGQGGAIADGTQKRTSTCSITVQGTIPTFENMVSSIITSPGNGSTIKAGTDFKVSVKTQNMDLGFFEDPNTRYYSSPQTLNAQGKIEGHQHVTIQAIGGNTPPDPRTESLVFFKGLDQKDVGGELSATVPGTATAGKTGQMRICTITGSRGHQPVIMPVAQRGSQDDCIRVNMN